MEKMIERIAKLLAMAEGTSNPAEAQAFSAKAEELMIAYGIEQALIDAKATGNNVKPEQIVIKHRPYKGKSYAKAQMKLGYSIARALKLQAYYIPMSNDSSAYTLAVVGFERDVELALQLIDSLQLQASSALRVWWADSRHRFSHLTATGQLIERRTFIVSFGRGAAERVETMYAKATAEAEAKSVGSEVALVDRQQQVKAYVASHVGPLGRGRGNAYGSSSSHSSGLSAGRKADVGGRGLGGSRGIGR